MDNKPNAVQSVSYFLLGEGIETAGILSLKTAHVNVELVAVAYRETFPSAALNPRMRPTSEIPLFLGKGR
jgi:hypothetical protein